MRILITIPTLKIGGAESFIINLFNNMVQRKDAEVFLLNLNVGNFKEENPLELRIKKEKKYYTIHHNFWIRFLNEIKVLYKPFWNSIYNAWLIRQTKRKIMEINPDIIHSNLIDSDRIILRSNGNIPVVITTHGCYFIESEDDRSDLLKKCDHIVSVSNLTHNKTKTFYHQNNISVIRYGYIKQEYIKHVTRTELDISEDSFVFIQVARGVQEKGWLESVKAFTDFKNYNNAVFIAVGDGPGIDEAKNYVRHNNLNNVIFTGYQTSPQAYMAISNVCLLPSYASYESLPLALIEAIFENLPILATRVGGLSEIVEHPKGNAGKLINLKNGRPDVEELTKGMNELFDNYSTYKSNTNNLIERFSIERCNNEYFDLFQMLVGSKKT